jgi:hypothetical protein
VIVTPPALLMTQLLGANQFYNSAVSAATAVEFVAQPEEAATILFSEVGAVRAYLPEGFVYYFLDQDRNSFERLSKPPLVDFLAEATEEIEFDVKLKFKDLETSLDHETSLEHTPSGIGIIRKIRDGSGNEQKIDQN